MKKRLFDLQLFADESASVESSDTAAAEQEKPTETKEPVTAATPNKQEPKYTDDDVDRIVKGKIAEERKKAQKEVAEAEKLATMNATEKANYERDKAFAERDDAIRERDEMKKQMALADMAKTARKMLSDNGITVSDELLSMLVTADAATTKAAVDNFTQLFNVTVENKVKDRLRGETPKAGTASGGVALSEIDKRIKKYSV